MTFKPLEVTCLIFYLCVPSVIYGLTNSTIVLRANEVSDKSPDVWCKFQPNGYDCNESGTFLPFYYFDTKLEDCKLYYFGRCEYEYNKFKSKSDCSDTCSEPGVHMVSGNMSASLYCRFQPDFGLCNSYFPKWYYDITSRTCKGFSYSGCGGNLNRFTTFQICTATCGPAMEHRDTEMK